MDAKLEFTQTILKSAQRPQMSEKDGEDDAESDDDDSNSSEHDEDDRTGGGLYAWSPRLYDWISARWTTTGRFLVLVCFMVCSCARLGGCQPGRSLQTVAERTYGVDPRATSNYMSKTTSQGGSKITNCIFLCSRGRLWRPYPRSIYVLTCLFYLFVSSTPFIARP